MRHCIIAATLMLTAAAPALAQNPDCTIAQEAADAIAARWSDMAGEAAQGEVTAHTAEGEGGFCAAAVSVFVDADSPEQSPAYRALIEAYMRGQAGILQIGQT